MSGVSRGLLAGLALAGLVAMALPARAGNDLGERLLRTADGTIPTAVSGLRLRSTGTDAAVHLLFDGADGPAASPVEVVLTPRDDDRPALARTPSFNLDFKGPTTGGRPAPPYDALVAAVTVAVTSNDPGGLTISVRPNVQPPAAAGTLSPDPLPQMRPDPMPDAQLYQWADATMRLLGIALVIAFLLLLPVIGRFVALDLRRAVAPPAGAGLLPRLLPWAVGIAVLGGLLARLLAPHLLAMHYMGYVLAVDAASLRDIPKYGPGALALYHLLFQVTGTSHVAMTYLNAVLGALLPLAGGALLVRLGAGASGVAAGVVLLALSPVFVHDATTESLLVPTTLWTVCALGLALRYRQGRAVIDLVAAALLAVLAMYSRPESLALVPLAFAVLWCLGPAEGRPRTVAVVAVLVAAGLLLGARVVHLKVWMDIERSLGNLGSLFNTAGYLGLLSRDLPGRNLALWPHLFPAGVTALAIVSPLLARRRLVAGAFLALGTAWIAVSLVDLPYVSVSRVQVPGVVFITLAAALSLEGLLGVQAQFLPRFTAVVLALAECTALTSTMVSTIPALWQRTNAADEEDLLADARAALPAEPVVLVRRGYFDEPRERVHLYSPDYAFQPPFRNDVTMGPDRFLAAGRVDPPAFFLLGTRCYLRSCDAPREMHPSCRAMLDRFRLEPVFERIVPVRRLPVDRDVADGQEMDFPWCLVAKDEMRLGLFRVQGPKEGADRPPAAADAPSTALPPAASPSP